MSVPTAELTAPATPARGAERSLRLPGFLSGGNFYLGLGFVAVVIAALTLLIPSTPSYDPWAWLVWGHEIVHLDLHTTGGPSWKPLPLIFTTVFGLFGKAQPDLWLVVARAGAIVAVVMVFRLAWRLTRALGSAWAQDGIWSAVPAVLAGAIAAGSLVNSGGFISDNALGYSEGLATALVLIAVERHMLGARRQAFTVAFFAALDRPELWLFWGPYGLWLFWRDPGARKLVVALFALIPVLWFVPELWGSGHLLRGVTRAQHPRSNSAAFASCPVCKVFTHEAWRAVLNRVKVPGIIALVAAAVGLWRTRRAWWPHGPMSPAVAARAWLLVIGVFGFVWWLGIAVETEAGFSGNNRYLVLGTAPVSIAGGVAWGWFMYTVAGLMRRAAGRGGDRLRRLGTGAFALPAGVVVGVALFLAVPPWITKNVVSLPRTHHALVYQARLRSDATAAVQRAGGREALLRCGSIMTEGFQVPMLAWILGVPTLRVEATPLTLSGPPWPNVIFQNRAQSKSTLLPSWKQINAWEHAGARYRVVAHNRAFRVLSTCQTRTAA